MAKLKTTQVKVTGLATNPNKYALPVGSCAEAMNVMLRRPGVIESMYGDRQLLTVDTIGFYKPVKAFLDKNYGGRVAVVQADLSQKTIWDPSANETQTGIINTFYFDNVATTPQYSTATTALQIGFSGTSAPFTRVNRDPGFIPGMTHDAYNHFRTLVTEKWGVIVNFERYAGLYPLMLIGSTSQEIPDAGGGTLDQNNWLEPGNTTSYRAILTQEVAPVADGPILTPAPKDYINLGPPSAVIAFTNDSFAENTSVVLSVVLDKHDALPLIDTNHRYYVEIYRSPQGLVEDPTELPPDFRRVAKLRVPTVSTASFPEPGTYIWVDTITEDARDGGEALYTNPGIQGEQGSNYCPPSSADIAVYKDTTFYANRVGLPSKNLAVAGAFGDLLTTTERTYGIGHRLISGTAFDGNTFFATSVDDLVGVKVGQSVTGDGWVGSLQVVITAVSTTVPIGITVNYPWTGASGAADIIAADRILVTTTYADGTSDSAVIDPTAPTLSAITWHSNLDTWPAGLRVIHPGYVQDSYPPQDGYELTIIHTTPWRKRVKQAWVNATNGTNYSPQVPEFGVVGDTSNEFTYELRRNIIWYSKEGQPESVPLGNSFPVGSGTILKMWATVSALFVLSTDGLWRVTGTSAPWTVDQIEPTAVLVHPDLVTSLNNQVFAVITDGVAIINDTGAQVISEDAIGQQLRSQLTKMRSTTTASGVRQQLPYMFGPVMAADQNYNEVWICLTESGFTPESAFVDSYVFNMDTQSFVRQNEFYKGICYYEKNQRLVYITGTETWWINVKYDFTDDPSPFFFKEAEIEFNPLVSEDQGNLKQWMDANFFLRLGGTIETLWNGESRTVDEFNQVNVYEFETVHFWVPRRYALKPSLEKLGFTTTENSKFALNGFSVRYRVASDTLKRE